MEDPTEQHESQDDFEESLVRAVIEENPPEEQGFRDEWKKQTGWHRKEAVFLRGRQNTNQPDREDANEGSLIQNKIVGNHQSLITTVSQLTKSHSIGRRDKRNVWIILSITISCVVFAFLFYYRRKKGKGGRVGNPPKNN